MYIILRISDVSVWKGASFLVIIVLIKCFKPKLVRVWWLQLHSINEWKWKDGRAGRKGVWHWYGLPPRSLLLQHYSCWVTTIRIFLRVSVCLNIKKKEKLKGKYNKRNEWKRVTSCVLKIKPYERKILYYSFNG